MPRSSNLLPYLTRPDPLGSSVKVRTGIFALVLFLLTSLLSSCSLLPWYDGEVIGSADVFGVKVRYLFPKDDLNYASQRDGIRYVGMVVYSPLGRGCDVLLRRSYFDRTSPSKLRTVVAHEVGHCLDKYVLGYTHNGFADEGCHYGAYWCRPNEGFANLYAHFVMDSCGSLAPLGWPYGDDPATCDALPHPAQATPDLIMTLAERDTTAALDTESNPAPGTVEEPSE